MLSNVAQCFRMLARKQFSLGGVSDLFAISNTVISSRFGTVVSIDERQIGHRDKRDVEASHTLCPQGTSMFARCPSLYERMQIGQRKLGSMCRRYALRTPPSASGLCGGDAGGGGTRADREDSKRARNDEIVATSIGVLKLRAGVMLDVASGI